MKKIYDTMEKAINDLTNIRDRLHNHSEENMAINIIVDDSQPDNQVLVEIENDAGKSIRIGEELRDESGLRKIRISTSDIINSADV